MNASNIVMNRPAVEMGLSVLDADGDFAGGVIAYEGDWLGADEFISFDKEAICLLQSQEKAACLLS
jgi:predicted nucleic-acid-binding protein